MLYKNLIPQREVGQNSLNTVLICKNVDTGDLVVVKEIHGLREIFDREVRAGKLLDHENIVKFIDAKFDESSGYGHIVLEYIDGVDFQTYMFERKEELSEIEAKKIFLQIIKAVKYCHDKGVIHRDLKLENIMITKKGRVKIIDFGLCDFITSEDAKFTQRCGSDAYVCPQIISDTFYTKSYDVWTMGIMLFAVLHFHYPFDETRLHNGKTHPTVEFGTVNLTPECQDLIEGMLAIEEKDRLTIEQILEHPWMRIV